MSVLGGEAIIELRGDDRRLKKDIKDAGTRGGKDFSDGFEKESKGRLGKGFRDSMLSAGARITGVMTAAGAVGPALLAVGSAMSAAASGLVAVGAAIGPAVVAGAAAYAGALLAVKSAIAVTSFAFDGMKEAIAGDQEAMDKLGPAGERLATTLQKLSPGVERIRRSVGAGLFPGVEAAASRLSKAYFPLLRTQGNALGTVLGNLANQGSKMVASGPWRKDFGTVASANAQNVSLFGRAGLQLADALRSLFVTAQPLITAFAQFTLRGATAVNQFVQAKRASGELADFWARAAATGAQLGRILGNVGVGLGRIFAIGGGSVGKSMLTNLEQMSDKFRDWTLLNTGKISGFFINGQKNLAAMGRLIDAVSGGLSKLGGGQQLAPLIDQIRTQIGPGLQKFLENANAAGALEKLVTAVGKVVDLFAQLSANDGSLVSFASTLDALASAALWVTQNVPGASTALGALFTALGVGMALKLVGLGPLLGAIGAQIGILGTRMAVAAGFANAETGAITANSIARRISTSTLGTWIGVKAIEAGAWLRSVPGKIADTAAMLANKAVYGVSWLVTFIATKAAEAGTWIASTAATVASTAAQLAAAAAARVVRGAIIAWTAVQWALNAAMYANPIGIVIAVIVALVVAIVVAYKKSETFRNIVNKAFAGVVAAAKAMWGALKAAFRFITNAWMTAVEWILRGAAKAFGWVPGIGPKLRRAAAWFSDFKSRVNNQLSGIKDRNVKITATAESARATLRGFISEVTSSHPVVSISGRRTGGLSALLSPGHSAMGQDNWRGGWTEVGEHGKELVHLPKGARVIGAGDYQSGNVPGSAFGGQAPTFNLHLPTGDPEAVAQAVWARMVQGAGVGG